MLSFSFAQRLQIAAAGWIGSLILTLVGRTWRWTVIGWENWEAARRMGEGLIYTFWHREVSSATWFWRKRGIVVMTSQNFDGEIIARVILKQGYGAARGSSSRGADAAFTIDRPRGPRFVAKGGAVTLSRAAILCFHMAPLHAHVFERSWDHHQIPYPFTRVAVFIAPPIVAPRRADASEMDRAQSRVQATLDDLRRQGDEWVRRTLATGDTPDATPCESRRH